MIPDGKTRPIRTYQQSQVSINNSSDISDYKEHNNYKEQKQVGKFMYLPVSFKNSNVAALLDTGSNVNLMSTKLYQSLSHAEKSVIQENTNVVIKLASNQTINVVGQAEVKARLPQGHVIIPVHILDNTSHPFILGCSFLASQGVVLDMSKHKIHVNKVKGRVTNATRLSPHSETIIWVKLPDVCIEGLQGVCTNICSYNDVLIARSIVTVNNNNQVPVKIMNVSDHEVTLKSNSSLVLFEVLKGAIDITPMNLSSDSYDQSNNVRLTPGQTNDNIKSRCHEYKRFSSYFDLSDSQLTNDEQETLKKCLYSHKSVFVTPENPSLGMTDLVKHNIKLRPNAKFGHQRSYRLTPEKRTVLKHQLEELLAQGVIAYVENNCDLPITSPVVLVSKHKPAQNFTPGSKEASLNLYRFCCDFRFLNEQTEDFNYTIPNLQELAESFAETKPKYFTVLDVASSYFNLQIDTESQKYTAFNTCFGTFRFLRMPQGLKTSAGTFQLLMDKLLRGLTFKSALCYVDDTIIFSESFDQHIKDIDEVLTRFHNAGLKLGPNKCHFAKKKVTFLGHEVSEEGLHPPADRVRAIIDYPNPKTLKAVRRLNGMLNWLRKYIPNLSMLVQPINRLQKRGVKFEWTQVEQQALDKIKSIVSVAPCLAFPRYDVEFRLAVDSCKLGVGYVLFQIYPESEFPANTPESERTKIVRFGSKSLKPWQSRYAPTKLELLGVITSILDCVCYLRGPKRFKVYCDHQALKPIFQKKMKGAIYERWVSILQQFNFDIEYKSAAQMVLLDVLSRCFEDGPISVSSVSSPSDEDKFFPLCRRTSRGH